MTIADRRLTDELVRRALGWYPTSDRYMKPGRSWVPRSRFRPLHDIRNAFQILDAASCDYSVLAVPGNGYTVEVRAAGSTGEATDKSKPRAICMAVANALGIPEGIQTASTANRALGACAKGQAEAQ